jgi:hypothetical protein
MLKKMQILCNAMLTDADDTEVFCQRRNFVKEDLAGYITGANSRLDVYVSDVFLKELSVA